MIRGTTPYHIFPLPIPADMIDTLYITYSQYDDILFEKTLKDCEMLEGQRVRVHLSQEETFLFSTCEHSHKVEAQLTLLSKTGERYSNDVERFSVEKALKEEVIFLSTGSGDPEEEPIEPLPSMYHVDLEGREEPNQHPISAITGLEELLDNKVDISETAMIAEGEIAVFSEEGSLECCGHTVSDLVLKDEVLEYTGKEIQELWKTYVNFNI